MKKIRKNKVFPGTIKQQTSVELTIHNRINCASFNLKSNNYVFSYMADKILMTISTIFNILFSIKIVS